MHKNDIETFCDEIEAEYKHQREKYTPEFCAGLTPETWALILAEETGEVADAVLKMMRKPNDFHSVLVDNAETECIHVAATALSTWLAIKKWNRENKGRPCRECESYVCSEARPNTVTCRAGHKVRPAGVCPDFNAQRQGWTWPKKLCPECGGCGIVDIKHTRHFIQVPCDVCHGTGKVRA